MDVKAWALMTVSVRREKRASRRSVVVRVLWGESIRSAVSLRRRRRDGGIVVVVSWVCWDDEGGVGSLLDDEEGSCACAGDEVGGSRDIPGSEVEGDSSDGDEVGCELGRTPDSCRT